MNRTLPIFGVFSLLLPACPEPITSCFIAGTQVWTPTGPKPIEALQAGDVVWSWDTESNQPVRRAVLQRIVGEALETIRLQAGEQVIAGVTEEHPFWVPTAHAWLTAGTLVAGQEVMCWLGQHEARTLPLQRPQRTRHKQPVPVYTLSLDGPEHNFFANGLLAHNKSPPIPQCFAFEFEQSEADLSLDFGEVVIGEEANATTTLRVFWQSGCQPTTKDERQLLVTLDDPDDGFRMETMSIELLEDPSEQLLELPIAFIPNTPGTYEGQVVFEFLEVQNELAAPPHRVQLFGTGQAAD